MSPVKRCKVLGVGLKLKPVHLVPVPQVPLAAKLLLVSDKFQEKVLSIVSPAPP